jgi:hypothetical protein
VDSTSKSSPHAVEKRTKSIENVKEVISKRRETYEKNIIKSDCTKSTSNSNTVRRHLSKRANRASLRSKKKASSSKNRQLLGGGRRGGGVISHFGSFTLSSGNRAGNSEEDEEE